jgi:acyl carrier protein
MQDIEQDLHQFVVDTFLFGTDDGGLSANDSFLEKGLVDSMGILALVSHVEERYGIRVEDTELIPENWDSVGRIAKFIVSKAGSTVTETQASCAD